MRVLPIALLLSTASCSAVLNFHECDTSKDCANRMVPGGAPLYCSSAHQCLDTSPCFVSVEATASGAPLVVGGMYALSGMVNDHEIRQAADLAAVELNADLKVPIRHVVCDTAENDAQAQKAFKILAEQFHAVAVVGPDTSNEVVAIAPLAQQYGIVVVTPSATNPAIVNLITDKLIWRTCPDDNLQAKVLAQLVPSTASLDIVWVSPDTYADGLEQAFVSASGRSDAKGIPFMKGMASTVPSQMTPAPAYALLIADQDAPALVAALKNAPGQSATQYLMTDAALAPTLYGVSPFDYTYLNRIRGTAPALPAAGDASGPVYQAFAQNYKTRFNNEDPANNAFVANAYDALYVIALAAQASTMTGTRASGHVIATNLGRMTDPMGQTLHVGINDFTAGVMTVSGNGNLNVVGSSGPINFDPTPMRIGNLRSAPFEVWQIVMGTGGTPTFKTTQVITP